MRTCYGNLWHDDDATTYTSGNSAVKINDIATTDWEIKFQGNTNVIVSFFKVGLSPVTHTSDSSLHLTQTIQIYDGYEQLSLSATTSTIDADLITSPAGFLIFINGIAANEASWKCAKDADFGGAAPVDDSWKAIIYDDSTWTNPTTYGANDGAQAGY